MIPILLDFDRSEVLRSMRRGFTEQADRGSATWISLLWLALAAAALFVLLAILNRIQQGKPQTETGSATRLFRDVIKDLSLSMKDRALLVRMVSHLKLPHPAAMLLTPEIFAETTYAYAATAPGRNTGADLTHLAEICRRIFDQEMPPPPSQGAATKPPRERTDRSSPR
jgi:hypothetical protein